jgi:hypothetical protein
MTPKTLGVIAVCVVVTAASFIPSLSAGETETVVLANRLHSGLLRHIDIAQSKSRPQLEREESFANLVNFRPEKMGAEGWTIKDGFLDLLIADPEFFFGQMVCYPSFFEEYVKSFSLGWLYKGKSNYPEKKQLALKQIDREILDLEQRLTAAKELRRKIEETTPTEVD